MAPLAGSGQRLEKQKDKKGPRELVLLGFTPPAWPQARPPGSSPSRGDDGQDASSRPWRERMAGGGRRPETWLFFLGVTL